ncbi:MAG: hypothetical protein JXR42_00740 [Gammaproteobacteria bacterium]|nr:hypothetical protein [Gammaproteobacteria bacterium]
MRGEVYLLNSNLRQVDYIDAIDERLSRSVAILQSILSSSDEFLALEREQLNRLLWTVNDYLQEITCIKEKLILADAANCTN